MRRHWWVTLQPIEDWSCSTSLLQLDGALGLLCRTFVIASNTIWNWHVVYLGLGYTADFARCIRSKYVAVPCNIPRVLVEPVNLQQAASSFWVMVKQSLPCSLPDIIKQKMTAGNFVRWEYHSDTMICVTLGFGSLSQQENVVKAFKMFLYWCPMLSYVC